MKRILCTRLGLIAILLASILLNLDSQATVGAQSVPDYRFGVVEAYASPAEASALGAGWTRITFEWNRIQPTSPEEWNVAPISDSTLAGELGRGRQVVGLLNTTPGWATDMGIGPGVPQGLYLPTDDPNNHWANFVRTIVERYAGRVDHWIIWNEPDIPASSHDVSWGGSVEDFVQLLRVAYTVAKQTNPNATIHMAGITHWHNDRWFGRFLDALVSDPNAAANNYYFDAASLNLYLEPEKIYDVTVHYYREMQNRGIYKPIWITETNAYLSRVSPEEQAYFIFQAFAVEIAAGAQRIAVYKMIDTETDSAADPEPFGLVQMDGSRRPAFRAYQMATTYLAGFQGGNWDRRDNIARVIVDRGPRTTIVVWARTPEPQYDVSIEARTTRALLVDVWGGARYIHPERGYYYLDLPGANCAEGCIMGGAPYMLIEEAPVSADTAPPPASPTPYSGEGPEPTTPSPDASPTPSLTSTFAPTPTPTPNYTPAPTATLPPAPTSTPTPVPTPTSTPVPIRPLPQSDIPPGRPWLLIGVLALAMGGTAITAGRKRAL